MSYEIQKGLHDIVHEEYPFEPCYTASDYGPTDIAYCEYDPGMLGKGMEKYGLIEQKDTTPRPMWVREKHRGRFSVLPRAQTIFTISIFQTSRLTVKKSILFRENLLWL